MRTQRDQFFQIVFTRQKWLTESQIKSLFSKFSTQLKRGTREEPTEEEVREEEDNMVAIENFLEINLIEEELGNPPDELNHPINERKLH